MRYRALDADGDYSFGQGPGEFLVDSPEAVGQAAKTRLALWTGEWFLDLLEGTPYATQILGENTKGTYDQAIQERIIETPGVTRITEYASTLQGRALSVAATIMTQYGETTIQTQVAT